ncbi:DUF1329 domain-containing protein [Pseudomonas marincola]|uniref:DUF1329 domain-containing protein n=1 Tax=Pseudomonas marincola TaxID=437900 RepID=UPI0008F1A719|nr:DUF1329 domain-containing protein [Pseudomonas marincola]SFU14220.1 Protein of unknown function [Pseudomonas marincola]
MRILKLLWIAALVAQSILLSSAVYAAATPEEIARLGKDLTCVGAEKAGNADGSITEWTGKWLGAPEGVSFEGTGKHPIDPYPNDKPLFVITAQNMSQYADRLSAGQKALFETYPQTYSMPVYPTRRDFRFPESVCKATLENAKNAKLVSDGEGVEATTGGMLFPFPKTGLELMWTSSFFTYRPWTEEYVSDNAYVISNGTINWGRVHSKNLAPGLEPGRIGKTEGQSSYYLNETLLPQRDRGEINTGMEFYNHTTEPRQSWRYDPGTRRVRQSPEYGFDMQFPGTGGSITVDEVRIFNGSGQRFNWTIVGKKEMYVPANAYRIHSPDIKYADLLPPFHANPKYMRYELRRVWVLEGDLKEGYRHLYSKRRMYVDEDTWLMIMADNYDARGGLWRTSMINYFYDYAAKTWQAGVGLYHDLEAKSYLAFNLINEQAAGYSLNRGDLTPRDFGPEAARRAGR